MLLTQTYELQPGDTLPAVAERYGLTAEELLDANPQLADPRHLVVGQLVAIPGPDAALVAAGVGPYDGIHPAPGTMLTNRAALIFPPVTSTEATRSAGLYDEVIDQLAVGYNPRYLPGGGFTYCNIFVWDVTRAMNCPIPHWITATGAIAAPFQAGAYEVNINGGAQWMKTYGVPAHQWQPASAATAQDYANAGKVAVAIWRNPTGGHGHTAMVRPGQFTPRGPATAQAGSINFNKGHLADGFGSIEPLFYVHA